jgi:hypothetical protein
MLFECYASIQLWMLNPLKLARGTALLKTPPLRKNHQTKSRATHKTGRRKKPSSSEETTVPVTNNKRAREKTHSQLKPALPVTTRNFFAPQRTAKVVSGNVQPKQAVSIVLTTSVNLLSFVLQVPTLLIRWTYVSPSPVRLH